MSKGYYYKHKLQRTYLRIVRSCVTGAPVFLYRGTSREAFWKAYYRAIKRERQLMRLMPKKLREGKAALKQLISEAVAGIPLTATLTAEQRAAIRRLNAVADSIPDTPEESPLLQHVRVKKKRDYDRRYREQNREKVREADRRYRERKRAAAAQAAKQQEGSVNGDTIAVPGVPSRNDDNSNYDK